MSRSDEPDSPSETDEQAVPSRAPIDRARLERIFGDVFPDTTADEREPGEGPTAAAGDEWLRRQRPPHHG
ncbi:hypothetical protein CJ177_01295 [Rhodococcus sp. ACPA1]|nr:MULTISPECIES: hypothetical protein [Rhodococcus]PBC59477.1 hypothetical protein CJ177_01295 [Rhodococcus sp. ACPA1]